jgi:hypothetical protein
MSCHVISERELVFYTFGGIMCHVGTSRCVAQCSEIVTKVLRQLKSCEMTVSGVPMKLLKLGTLARKIVLNNCSLCTYYKNL